MHTGLGRRTGGTSDSLGSQFLPGRLENRFFLGLPGVFSEQNRANPFQPPGSLYRETLSARRVLPRLEPPDRERGLGRAVLLWPNLGDTAFSLFACWSFMLPALAV